MAELEHIEACLRTDTGRVRDHNEDFVDCWEPTNLDEAIQNGWLYIVADGVGGADAGEVASQFASERMISHYLNNHDDSDWGERLIQAMQAANTDLRQFVAERNDNSRMATTMVAAVIHHNKATIGNVGDSRGYHWQNGELKQITKDQSLVAKLVEEGAITEEEASLHPRRNVILYSLGSERQPKIDLFELTLDPGDILLLCSDGLTRHVTDEEIKDMINHKSLVAATESLIQLANERGGEDNISVAILRYLAQTTAETETQTMRQEIGTPTYVPANPRSSAVVVPQRDRVLLWLVTIALSMVQIILIFLVWILLRV
jgi:serine/threonine protein phosphatase PrpC